MKEYLASDIHFTRAGKVTCRNYTQLGYERLIRGVYARMPQVQVHDDWAQRRAEFIPLVQGTMAEYEGRGAVLHGITALQVLGVALPHRIEDWVNCHVLFPPGVSRPKRCGVRAHRHPEVPKVWGRVMGMPVLHPMEHLLHVRGASDDDVIEIADGFLRRRNPLLELTDMRSVLDSLSGRPGIRQARRVMKWVRPNTDSLYETRTRLILVRAGLPEPQVNLPVFCRGAGRWFHLDLGYEKEKLGIEYDGSVHVNNREQMEFDANRRRHLQDEGWLIITVTATLLQTPIEILRSVETALVLRQHTQVNRW